jgi:hypothetical protein
MAHAWFFGPKHGLDEDDDDFDRRKKAFRLHEAQKRFHDDDPGMREKPFRMHEAEKRKYDDSDEESDDQKKYKISFIPVSPNMFPEQFAMAQHIRFLCMLHITNIYEAEKVFYELTSDHEREHLKMVINLLNKIVGSRYWVLIGCDAMTFRVGAPKFGVFNPDIVKSTGPTYPIRK